MSDNFFTYTMFFFFFIKDIMWIGLVVAIAVWAQVLCPVDSQALKPYGNVTSG
jgi:hypothetical protein